MLMIESPFSVEQLVEATKETVRVNNIEACYIRPLIYLGYGEMGLNPLPCSVNVSIAVWPWGTYLGDNIVWGTLFDDNIVWGTDQKIRIFGTPGVIQ